MRYTHNPRLQTNKDGWMGTPVDDNNLFVNVEFPYTPGMAAVLKWQLSRNPQKKEKEQDRFRLQHSSDLQFLHSGEDCIVWLGHASFFIRLSGVSLLIDPVFYNQPFVKRVAEHAFGTSVFRNLDYLLLSHDHRDHCQERSIREIVAGNPGIRILTGLNMEELLRPWCGEAPVQCAGWYQQYETGPGFNVVYMPTRHWGRRGLFDTNKRLWGGFILQSANKTIYFGGDTGYGSHLKEAGTLFPAIDVAILGVGAYKPEWFMHPSHISPLDAIRAFHELKARVFIPMHYGTFDLSDEPVGEPYRILKAEEAAGRIHGTLVTPALGESYVVR